MNNNILAEYWKTFEKDCRDMGMHEDQIMAMQAAYYAGASSVHHALASCESIREVPDKMISLHNEIIQFVKDAQNKDVPAFLQ